MLNIRDEYDSMLLFVVNLSFISMKTLNFGFQFLLSSNCDFKNAPIVTLDFQLLFIRMSLDLYNLISEASFYISRLLVFYIWNVIG